MHEGQYIRQEFGHHKSMRYRMFPPLLQNSHGLRASATGGNQFGWPSPNCPPYAESSWSAPAKAAAHAANVTNKCWTARRFVNAVAQKVNLRVRGICKGFRNEQKTFIIWSDLKHEKSRSICAHFFSALLLELLRLCYRPCKDWVIILWCGFIYAIWNAV